MASACKFFDEDAVYRINRKKFIDVGLVLENSEFISSDDEQSDDPGYKDWERMKKGHIRVAWHPNGAEEVLPERKVKLCDRSLMPGDVVRKVVKGKDTQFGYCRYTVVTSDVQVIGSKQVIVGVNSKDLVPLEEFATDVAVFKDSWVGMVKTMKTEITLRCSDGSRCVMSEVDAFDMDDVLDRRDRASEFKKYSFYPGQQLWGPTYCFQRVKWLVLNKSISDILNSHNKSIRTTVEDVKIVSLGVQWVCKAYSEENFRNQHLEQPKYQVTGEDLKSIKMMNIFEPCTLQIGDRNYLVMKDCYEVMSLNEWKNRMSGRLTIDSLDSPFLKKKSAKKTANSIQNNNNVDINNVCNDYDDNSDFEDMDDEESGRSSDASSVTSHSTASSAENALKSSLPVSGEDVCFVVTPAPRTFCFDPHKKGKKGPHYATKMKKKIKSVRRRAMRHVMKEAAPLTPGEKLVTEALITETKADVVWQDGTVEHNILSTSLYPVHHLDSHEFFPGDYVVDNKDCRPYEYGVVKQVDHSGRTALISWLKTYHAGGNPHPELLSEEEVSVYDIKDHPDFKYRPGACVIRVVNSEDLNPSSTAGQVVDVDSSGRVEVSWVSGETSLCYPQELYRVGEYDSDDLWADDDSFSDEDSWETESEKSILGLEEGATEKEIEATAKEFEKVSFKKLFQEDDDEKSSEDMQEKLLANIEKLRAGMARLEEVFTQNPTLQTCNVMRRLLELYKHCKVLDQLLGTTYFHERHLQSLVERLKHRGRVNSIQHMADQIFRLFSTGDMNSDVSEAQSKEENNVPDAENVTESPKVDIDILIESPTDVAPAPNFNSTNCIDDSCNRKPLLSPVSPTSGSGSEPRNLCQQLCSILKSRLLKAHEDAELRFGMPRSETSAALLAAEVDQNQKVPTKDSEVSEASSDDVKDKKASTKRESLPNAEFDVPEGVIAEQGTFSILESVPDSHKYKLSIFQPTEPSAFFRIIKKEMKILKSSLPEGIAVKSFEDRIDLYSVLIKGPKRTPYEDGLFFFDFQFPADYPKVPPLCHYISYCSDRLNPNLYEGGKVCVSLLGTWGGKGTEVWNPETSNLLQVLVSIQGLILVSEPYYNEAGYERQKGTQQGMENSRMYNEMVVLKLVQAMSKLVVNPHEVFQEEIIEHFQTQSSKLIKRLEGWLTISETWNTAHPTSPTSPNTFKDIYNSVEDHSYCSQLPEFPLIPASKGFCLTLRKSLADFKGLLSSSNILQS